MGAAAGRFGPKYPFQPVRSLRRFASSFPALSISMHVDSKFIRSKPTRPGESRSNRTRTVPTQGSWLRRMTVVAGWMCGLVTMVTASADPPKTEPSALDQSASEKSVPKQATLQQSTTDPPMDGRPMDGREGRDLSVSNFRPIQQLVLPRTDVDAAAHPVVDVHNHFYFRFRDNETTLRDYVAVMDRNHMAVSISLDGRLGATLRSHHRFLNDLYPNRFVVFAHLDWIGDGKADEPATWAANRPGWTRLMTERLAAAHAEGIIGGLKIFKSFGLTRKNADGSLARLDDERFAPIWQTCGRLGLPVLIHTADPAAFFEPIGPTNERWEELRRHPTWSFAGDQFPSRDELFKQRNRMIAAHPDTQFICAHVANCSEDLNRVSNWLDRYPNMHIELASRISELGRQPRAARRFMVRYADRIMFGTDGPFPEKRLRAYWRFLQTDDESFDYSEKNPPPQGLWRIDGVDLPDDVLKKIYHENALNLIPTLREKFDAVVSSHFTNSSP